MGKRFVTTNQKGRFTMIKPKELVTYSYFDIVCYGVIKGYDPDTKERTYKIRKVRTGAINVNNRGVIKCIPVDIVSTHKQPLYFKLEDLYVDKDQAIVAGNLFKNTTERK